MRRTGRFLLVGLLIMGLVLCAAGCRGNNKTKKSKKPVLIVGSETTYPPFEMLADGEYVGIDMDLIKAIGEEQGYEIKIHSMGFDALIPALQADKVDCVVSAQSITEKRLQKIDFSEPYFQGGLAITVRADNEDITALEDLQGRVLAAEIGTTGASYCDKIKEDDATTSIKLFDSIGEAFMELTKGGADAIVNDWAVTHYYIDTEGKDKVKMVGDIFSADEQYGIGVKKGNTEMLDLINEGLAKVIENGTYDEIYNKWFGEIE